MQSGYDTSCNAFSHPITMVSYFKYLGRIISDSGDNWPVVVANIQKERKNWAWISRILGREGTYADKLGVFYNAVV